MYDFSGSGLMAGTKMDIIFFFFQGLRRHEIKLGTKMRIDPKCRDQKCIGPYISFHGHNYLHRTSAPSRLLHWSSPSKGCDSNVEIPCY